MLTKLASAIYNDVQSGLAGMKNTISMSLEQLEDDIVDERLHIIKEYMLKGLIPKKDLLMSLNCIELDCKSLDKCPCGDDYTNPELHFEIPQIVNDFGKEAVEYIGAIDKSQKFIVYTDTQSRKYHKYKRRGANTPYVYIDTTPNENNMYDGWVFGAPFVKILSIIAIFKDPRQLGEFSCCGADGLENYSYIYNEVKKRLTEKKIRYYRSLQQQPMPNLQTPQ